ncbi:asparagine synthase (glutamine-hydrolyzing) [Rhodopseudomonas palustris]|uniref:asparagine synthase (glutamine-hydrolyzing) n=1 Tax=Rhodopseudomonas palustris TaxID=1076 RepID=UPI0022F09DD8|nr:asparagine synthase (glutamine-hydrolyzing) [Rhodopseudomonas palustris]WBU31259.1 asparagine synthase (glutamine-hydrolyzing) [Rhodopseudomonas palustris]
MCGIAGLLDQRLAGNERELSRTALAMADRIAYRGPDASGAWVDVAAGLALSHRRLSIIDLTTAGAQPMISADGRWVVSYNGEVYNAADIRHNLASAGIRWRGHSDTEVVLESVAHRGLAVTLSELNGMYALALWDRRERVLHLARDRLGIKPLFLSVLDGRVSFGSELKALRAAQTKPARIDPRAVACFLRLGYIPAPYSIFSGFEKVLPGGLISIGADGCVSRSRYWKLEDAVSAGRGAPAVLSDAEAIAQLSELLADAVKRQMISDVALGAFLSGGVDSSTVTALMVATGGEKVRSFTVGFRDFSFDESAQASAVARHLGTTHTELIMTAADALAVVPKLSFIYDEPFADSSQIPTYLVSRLTRNHVSVALSGDGGDELFAGYNRHLLGARYGSHIDRIPRAARRIIAGLLETVPHGLIDKAARILPRGSVPARPSELIAKLASILPLNSDELYNRLVSQIVTPALHLSSPEYMSEFGQPSSSLDLLDRMRFSDTVTYLPDDILQKVDRASMAVSLEARPPFLDHRVVEFAWRLPRHFLIRDGETKWILRRVLDRLVPPHLTERPKMGFSIPLAEWLRGPLRDWADDLLSQSQYGGGLLNPVPAQVLWKEHLARKSNNAYQLWTLLMFESWRRQWT